MSGQPPSIPSDPLAPPPFLPHLLVPPRLAPSVFLFPGAIVLGDVELGEDVSVWYHTILRGDVNPIRVGARTNVQDLSLIHCTRHKAATTIGSDVTLGHRVTLHGCTIGDRVLVGMGAIVMDLAHIGDDCIIGAGSLVTEGTKIPPGSLVLGAPAKVKRAVTDEERAFLARSALNYREYVRAYRAAGYVSQPHPGGAS